MTQPLTGISTVLAHQGRSQAWLARKLRVSRQSIHHWIHGKEAVPRARQAQIAVTLGINAVDYFREDGYAK